MCIRDRGTAWPGPSASPFPLHVCARQQSEHRARGRAAPHGPAHAAPLCRRSSELQRAVGYVSTRLTRHTNTQANSLVKRWVARLTQPPAPGQKRETAAWERLWYWGFYGGMAAFGVLLYYKPDKRYVAASAAHTVSGSGPRPRPKSASTSRGCRGATSPRPTRATRRASPSRQHSSTYATSARLNRIWSTIICVSPRRTPTYRWHCRTHRVVHAPLGLECIRDADVGRKVQRCVYHHIPPAADGRQCTVLARRRVMRLALDNRLVERILDRLVHLF